MNAQYYEDFRIVNENLRTITPQGSYGNGWSLEDFVVNIFQRRVQEVDPRPFKSYARNFLCAEGATMTNLRSAAFFAALGLLGMSCSIAAAPQAHMSSTGGGQEVLSLNFSNNGQLFAAPVGQQIEITLGTVGPVQYATPEISSPAVRLEDVAMVEPPNPGGPTYIYIFEATGEGEAQIRIPVCCPDDPEITHRLAFAVTIHIRPSVGKPSKTRASRMLDQANTAVWTRGWTNFLDKRQTFAPSLPRLTAVEVELVVGNPGPPDDQITMMLGRPEGEVLASVTKTVTVTECSHVLFILPHGGVPVSPGRIYSIQLSGGFLFGWKYVVGGYEKGEAQFGNGKPLLQDAHSTFLFRTFGSR